MTDFIAKENGSIRTIAHVQLFVELLNLKINQFILRNERKLKDTGIVIYEEFSKDTIKLRKTLWEQVLEYRRENKFAYINYRSIDVRDYAW